MFVKLTNKIIRFKSIVDYFFGKNIDHLTLDFKNNEAIKTYILL